MCTGGPVSRTTAGQECKGRKGTELTYVTKSLSSIADPNHSSSEQAHEQCMDDLYKCSKCVLTFKDKSKLGYHMRTKHERGRLACPQCQCTFVSKAGLTQHVKHIHEKLPRYRCETCGKGYSVRSQYYDHLAAHTGVKRNVCPVCLKQFTFKPSLKTHILRFHTN